MCMLYVFVQLLIVEICLILLMGQLLMLPPHFNPLPSITVTLDLLWTGRPLEPVRLVVAGQGKHQHVVRNLVSKIYVHDFVQTFIIFLPYHILYKIVLQYAYVLIYVHRYGGRTL